MNRRSILKAIGLSPVAAPVIAREAAAKAGVNKAFTFSPPTIVSGPPSVLSNTQSHAQWLWTRVKEVMSPDRAEEIRREVMSCSVLYLDPDLASSRSLSLSAATRIQRERNVVRRLEAERTSWMAAFRKEASIDWLPDWSGKP